MMQANLKAWLVSDSTQGHLRDQKAVSSYHE